MTQRSWWESKDAFIPESYCKNLTSCAGTIRHARREFLCSKIAIFSQFQVYSNIIQKAKHIINLLLFNNFQ